MKKQSQKKTGSQQKQSQNLFRNLRSKDANVRYGAQRLLALIICVPLMLACGAYMCSWAMEKHRIEQENASYQELYQPVSTQVPENPVSAEIPDAALPAATEIPAAPSATPASTQAPDTAVPVFSEVPASIPPEDASSVAATHIPLKAPGAKNPAKKILLPSATPIPVPVEDIVSGTPGPDDGVPVFDVVADATLVPRSTPNADTIVFALETPPPSQFSFGDLLALNKETVGYLRVGDVISLPVVQRRNDNSYYLDHSFSGEESLAGTLFLDGSNLLVPEDDNLIIYGHNMRNGTMFHALTQYQDPAFLKEHSLVSFDTIYENRTYVPFAAFSVAMDEKDDRYLDLRQFVFDPGSFDAFIDEIKALSIYSSPVNAIYGDKLLMLVTCEYQHNDGRFIVVLREVRENENTEDMIALVRNTTLK